MTEPTIEEIAEKWETEIGQIIFQLIPGEMWHTIDSILDIDQRNKVKAHILSAIVEATEAQRKEIAHLNRCRDAHHEEIERLTIKMEEALHQEQEEYSQRQAQEKT